jgi:hypothetical protein
MNPRERFKYHAVVAQPKLQDKSREKGRLDTYAFLSADNKRCSVRRAARTSFGRLSRPALAATELTQING